MPLRRDGLRRRGRRLDAAIVMGCPPSLGRQDIRCEDRQFWDLPIFGRQPNPCLQI
jgi:hypothetical protein